MRDTTHQTTPFTWLWILIHVLEKIRIDVIRRIQQTIIVLFKHLVVLAVKLEKLGPVDICAQFVQQRRKTPAQRQ